ncbi:MAG: thioredoxin fold domain-containing protein [candidate division Zixibacteria bacterium]|nr:thioredoxin fold domain-containing protein [candidate division Zixibacteria bacterium]
MINVWKKAIPVVIISFFLLSPWCSPQKSTPPKDEKKVEGKGNPPVVSWLKYDEGLKLAKKENKKVMTFFYTDWCGYCKKMLSYTFTDQEVKKLLGEKFVSIKVNGESRNKISVNKKEMTEKELTSGFVASGFPTTWFFESNGDKISPMVGFMKAEDFINVLSYVAGDWYKKISFQDYLSKKNELGKKK